MLIKIVIILIVISFTSGCVEQKIKSEVESSVQGNQSIGMSQTSGNQSVGELKERIRNAIMDELENGFRK